VKFMQRGDLDSAQGNLDRIGSLVDAMGQLTSQLKSFARKSSGAIGPVQVRRAVDNALFLLDRRLRGAKLCIDVADDAVALCDSNRLEQVLVNLIGNALDALDGTAEPRLDIAARREGDRVTVTVRDNGPGLAEDVLAHLFEPFFTTKDSGSGLGLGLAISAGIVHDSGGTLSGGNASQGGAQFTFDLPAVTGDAP